MSGIFCLFAKSIGPLQGHLLLTNVSLITSENGLVVLGWNVAFFVESS